jgi:hypothetical protein
VLELTECVEASLKCVFVAELFLRRAAELLVPIDFLLLKDD